MAYERIFNFSAGPSMLPEAVLERSRDELLNYGGSGMSVCEMSHRSAAYDEIIKSVEAKLRSAMSIPDSYNVLFLQGGASLQFAMVPMNLMGSTGKADYTMTGQFSQKAAEEAQRYGEVHIACSSKDKNYTYIPQQDALDLSSDAAYFHYCMNNTIFGTKWNYIPKTSAPLACDMSSCILSEPIDVSKFGLIYAGAQKNMAPAGVTVVIYDKSLRLSPPPYTPSMMDYALMAKNESMYNTPPTYAIYMLGLVLDHIAERGGTQAMAEYNREKAQLLYDRLDASKLFITTAEPQYRSMMNVTFKTPSEELDKAFVKGAAQRGMTALAGHRLAGGMRASIYNAMPREGIVALVKWIDEFEKENG